MLEMGQTVHHDFDGDGDLLFHFFGGAAGPLRDDLDVVVGDVGVCLDRQSAEGNDAPDEQEQGNHQNKEPAVQGEIDEVANHGTYCSSVFSRTRALATTWSPLRMPDLISCILPG